MPLDRTAFYADSSTALSLATITANMADAEADQIALREIQTFQWADAAARAAQTGMVEGDIGYQADTNVYYQYSGSAWGRLVSAIGSGLVSMVPTSVAGTGVSVAANGLVSFTGASTININGCFTSEFTNYRINVFAVHSTSAAFNGLLRASGSDLTASEYQRQTLTASSTTVSGGRTSNAASWAGISIASGTYEELDIILYNPQATQLTVGMVLGMATSTTGTPTIITGQMAIQYDATTSADGISFVTTAGTADGTIRISGIA